MIFPSLRSLQRAGSAGLPLPFQANRHCIVVNRHGQRFGNELALDFYERLNDRDANGAVLHLPAWIIADRHALRTAPLARWLIKSFDQGARSAPGLAELARRIDVPAATLQATVERYNSDVGRGRDTQFFRSESLWDRFEAGPRGGLGTIVDPPFLALPFNLSIFGTKGGACTDAVGAVLRLDGSVIDGLSAAGNAMANPLAPGATNREPLSGPA